MDVRLINPFIGAVTGIMPQIGFSNITRKGISLKEKKFMVSGVVLTLELLVIKKVMWFTLLIWMELKK